MFSSVRDSQGNKYSSSPIEGDASSWKRILAPASDGTIISLRVPYNLCGAGWSECFVEIGDQRIHVTASYLGDALGDLLRAVISSMIGFDTAHASFAEELGEYRWRLRRVSAGARQCLHSLVQ